MIVVVFFFISNARFCSSDRNGDFGGKQDTRGVNNHHCFVQLFLKNLLLESSFRISSFSFLHPNLAWLLQPFNFSAYDKVAFPQGLYMSSNLGPSRIPLPRPSMFPCHLLLLPRLLGWKQDIFGGSGQGGGNKMFCPIRCGE